MSTRVVKTVCSKDCPDVCGMLAHVEDGRVVKVEGDPEHPITQGFLCGRYQHYEEIVHHPDRLLHPLVRRRDGELRRATWDEALDIVTTRFTEIIERWGGNAILPYHYLGHLGIVASRSADRLWNRMNSGARRRLRSARWPGRRQSCASSGGAGHRAAPSTTSTQLYVAWGKNPKATNVPMVGCSRRTSTRRS